MNPQDMASTLEEIESNEFAVRLGVASNFRTFLRAAQQEEAVWRVLRELYSQGGRLVLSQILQRVLELSNEQVDFRYENPWDTALTVYLWLLSLKDSEAAETAASAVSRALNCWWATKIARSVLLREQLQNDAGMTLVDVPSPRQKPSTGRWLSNASDLVLAVSLPGIRPSGKLRIGSHKPSVSSPSPPRVEWFLGRLDYRIGYKTEQSSVVTA